MDRKTPEIVKTIVKIPTKLGYFIISAFDFSLAYLKKSAPFLAKELKKFSKSLLEDILSEAKKIVFPVQPVKLKTKTPKKKSKKTSKKRNPFDISAKKLQKIKKGVKKFVVKCTKRLKKTLSVKIKTAKLNLKKALAKIFPQKARYFIFGIAFASVFIFAPLQGYLWFRELPDTSLLVEKGNNRSTKILDRHGELLYEIYVDRKYNPVELEQIPEHVIQSTLAIEDEHFYIHSGFRVDSMVRALKQIIMKNELQGGSTITQQLVKNVLLSPERTVSRKAKELVLSVMVETKYSKDEILELYLNNIAYGGTAWGIESASQKFFGKHVWELDLAEASLLAGLPSSPTTYSPLTGGLEIAKERQRQVLTRMVEVGYVSQLEAEKAYDQPLAFAPQAEYIKAPHFVAYVRKTLEENYGKRFVNFGGLTVQTSLDLSLQEQVQLLVAEGVQSERYLNISNGASVVLDVATGELLAYVGSVDYFEEGWGAFDVVTAFRQPGSSIKPVTYALALSKGYTPASIIEDKPVSYPDGTSVYTPRNYDNKYHGNVTLRDALARSYNVPAVRLVNSVGTHNMVELGNAMGLKSWQVGSDYGLSVTLGGKEVQMIEHANVFATLARQGVFKDTTPFLSIKDIHGNEIYFDSRIEDQVLSGGVAYLISNILSDNVARAAVFGYANPLVIPGQNVAAKTGTTDNKKDNWTMGYTPSYVVGVWVGNNDGTPTYSSGVQGAGPIFNRIMSLVLEDKKAEAFVKPDEVFVKYDEKCNKSEVFVKGSSVPQHLCVVEEDKDDDEDD